MDVETLSFCKIFVLVTLGGAFGGALYFINRLEFENDDVSLFGKVKLSEKQFKIHQFLALLGSSMLLGIGGALAIQFLMIGIGKFQNQNTAEALMTIFSISVVAGFGGRRFLSVVTNKLEQQIDEARKESQTALGEAQESLLISSAMATLQSRGSISERIEYARKIEKLLESAPKDRTLTILAGRLYRNANKDYISALRVLDRFLSAKDKDNEKDKDYADVLYNKACYQVQMSKNTTPKDLLVTNAIRNLEESISISPDNARDAINDTDFSVIKDTDFFKKLVIEVKKQAETIKQN